ncbi:MAG: transcription-repair coupling factor [Thermodesulfovibrio sp.]|nr:transcription-repair coupling factor [Thermodesulfovibrio sp.]
MIYNETTHLNLSQALIKEKNSLLHLLQENNEIYNISSSSLALGILLYEQSFILVEESEDTAQKIFTAIKTFGEFFGVSNEIMYLPSEGFERTNTIIKFLNSKGKRLITTKDALMFDSEIIDLSFHIKKESEIVREELSKKLIGAGYSKVEIVVQEGEFSHHGWVFDIWNAGEEYPCRIEFFGDIVEEIKYFYPETQKSFKSLSEILIVPYYEAKRDKNIIEFVSPEILITTDRDLLPDSSINCRIIKISHIPYQFSNISMDAKDKSIAGLGIIKNERKSLFDFPRNLKKLGIPILIVLNSQGKAETVKEILFNHEIIAPIINKNDVFNYTGKYAITVGELHEYLFRENILIITDHEIFDEKIHRKKKPVLQKIPLDGIEIKEGDYVVHKEHGIGIFKGIKRQTYEDFEEDVLVLQYAEGDILYVPTWGIEKIYRYSAKEGFLPQIDKLGTNRWQKLKERERKKIHDIADKLLKLYAQRKTERGFIYSEDTEIHKNFDDFFPYEETEDQQKAINSILNKMREPFPMEILLCGDSGYGKTEVAMRAAFRAVYDKKQVAVLVPTTLLCEQHYRTFKKRFEAFPVRIEYLSRFRSTNEIKQAIEDTEKGKVDILIGTHMMIMKEVDFFDLGLLIIDEEQKFGVVQKEKLKEKFPKVDLITITATPIPRTLQIGLSGLWDIFIIQTPPKERLSVKSFIVYEDYQIIKEAIERELKRKGQVYFLHNRIQDINIYKTKLKTIHPSSRISIAHGRMRENQLNKIMLNFIEGEIDILVCTSIIASGIDIPNVNTIIINRADLFGLSDLYQIRGRVGRADKQAYAYFIVPPEELLTENAKKRIKSIQEMSYLGAGFHIALKDLEIRGAGELLGIEQSGVNRLGFDLYIEMLNETIKEMKGESIVETKLPDIKLTIPAYIPEDYIEETPMRIRIYRKLGQIFELSEINKLHDEIFDRFGKPPEEVENLFKLSQIRILSSKIKVDKVQQNKSGFKFTIQKNLEESFVKNIISLLNNFRKKEIIKNLKFYPDGFEIGIKELDSMILFLKRLISKLENEK